MTVKAFVPYLAPVEPARQDPQPSKWYDQSLYAGTVPVPPPDFMGGDKDLVCVGCEDVIEPGSDHIVLSSCVAVYSKKNREVVVSENHAESKDFAFHDETCVFHYVYNYSLENGDGLVDGMIEQYFGGRTVIPCVCSNCAADLEATEIPEPLCANCEMKMRP